MGCRDPNLHFVEQVALRPPEVVVDAAQQKAYEAELAKVMNVPLPVGTDLHIPPPPTPPPTPLSHFAVQVGATAFKTRLTSPLPSLCALMELR